MIACYHITKYPEQENPIKHDFLHSVGKSGLHLHPAPSLPLKICFLTVRTGPRDTGSGGVSLAQCTHGPTHFTHNASLGISHLTR